MKNIVIDGTEYAPISKGTEVKICVLQRGWVMVGYYQRDGDNCSLNKASVIRNWGTTKGLGEIALEGPKGSTKLDPTNGVVEFHRLTEVCTIVCKESEWAKFLK